MNSINHFLVSYLLLLGFVPESTILERTLFSLIFAVLIDLDILYGIRLGKPEQQRRTWVQEPFGIMIVGIPLAYLVSQFNPIYFWMVIISYASHVALDYITIHRVAPLAPFSQKTIVTGFVRGFPNPLWYKRGNYRRGLSEMYFLAAHLAIFVLI